MMSIIGGVIIIVGALLAMIGGVGVVRFGDLMSRVHAAAKAPTLALLLVALGAAIEIGTAKAIATLVLVVILQLATSPVATHVLARASYSQVPIVLDGEDDLAEHLRELETGRDPGNPGDSGEQDGPPNR